MNLKLNNQKLNDTIKTLTSSFIKFGSIGSSIINWIWFIIVNILPDEYPEVNTAIVLISRPAAINPVVINEKVLEKLEIVSDDDKVLVQTSAEVKVPPVHV